MHGKKCWNFFEGFFGCPHHSNNTKAHLDMTLLVATCSHYHSFCNKHFTFTLMWFVGLKLIQLEQQKIQLPLIIFVKSFKPILYRVIKGT